MAIRTAIWVSAAAFLCSAGAAIAGQPGEIGYKPGALGVNAIMSGDYQRAVDQLNAMDGVTETDPARLINLGNAYAGMGRFADAQAAYLAAYRSNQEIDMVMADGSVKSSKEIARKAMRRLSEHLASR